MSRRVVYEEKVPVPTLNYHFHVVITTDFDKATDLLDLPRVEGDPVAATFETVDSHHSYLLFYPNASEGTVAHEAWHGVRHMFSEIGAELENEMVAYHLDYLVDSIHNILKIGKKKLVKTKSNRRS